MAVIFINPTAPPLNFQPKNNFIHSCFTFQTVSIIMAANLSEKIESSGLQCDLMLDLSGNIDLLVSKSI
jgi:hypothetical protein